MADEDLKPILLTRRAFFPLVLAFAALPVFASGQAARAARASAKLIGVFDAEVVEALANAQMDWIALAPLADFVGYEKIRKEIAVAGPRVIVGATRAADYVIMRSLARDHGLREVEGGEAFASAPLANVSALFDEMRIDENRHRSWIFID